jgi:hypothetical protein
MEICRSLRVFKSLMHSQYMPQILLQMHLCSLFSYPSGKPTYCATDYQM